MENKSIEQTYSIKAPIETVWSALTDPIKIKQWTDSVAKMSENKGEKFELWDNTIFGKNMEMKKPTFIVQEWQQPGWNKPSTVTISLADNNGSTDVSLKQIDHPLEETDALAEGWDKYYFGAIKELLERS